MALIREWDGDAVARPGADGAESGHEGAGHGSRTPPVTPVAMPQGATPALRTCDPPPPPGGLNPPPPPGRWILALFGNLVRIAILSKNAPISANLSARERQLAGADTQGRRRASVQTTPSFLILALRVLNATNAVRRRPRERSHTRARSSTHHSRYLCGGTAAPPTRSSLSGPAPGCIDGLCVALPVPATDAVWLPPHWPDVVGTSALRACDY